jgi:hypothetical protein
MRMALIITGPVYSSGRSGLSWGSKEATDWDLVFWDAKEDIGFNVAVATSLGFRCFYIHWENDEAAKRLDIPNLELVPIEDTFLGKGLQITPEEQPMYIKKFGPNVKNSTFNDQRQYLAAQFGFNYLLELGFEISLRIRSDQRMNWVQLSKDLNFAYSSKRILFPAQGSLTSLDAGYTGFSVLDFFYGGDTRLLAEWFSHVLVGGRLYGPHQDIAWKPLMNSAKWKCFFPGMSILSDTNNAEKQLMMAHVFWQEFAYPSSKETMNGIMWRGNQLEVIDYKISQNDTYFNHMVRIEPRDQWMSGASVLPTHFEWDLVTRYLSGESLTSRRNNNTETEMLLDHFQFVLNRSKYRNRNMILQMLVILFRNKFRFIHVLTSFMIKIVSKSKGGR